MKIKNGFALFLVFSIFASALGVFPLGAHSGVSPMLQKGPQADLANAMSTTDPT